MNWLPSMRCIKSSLLNYQQIKYEKKNDLLSAACITLNQFLSKDK